MSQVQDYARHRFCLKWFDITLESTSANNCAGVFSKYQQGCYVALTDYDIDYNLPKKQQSHLYCTTHPVRSTISSDGYKYQQKQLISTLVGLISRLSGRRIKSTLRFQVGLIQVEPWPENEDCRFIRSYGVVFGFVDTTAARIVAEVYYFLFHFQVLIYCI